MRLMMASITLCLWTAFAVAETPRIEWSDLIDETVQDYEDPFRDLTFDQIDALRIRANAEEDLASRKISEDERGRLEEQIAEAEATLAADGLDADWLISQRWIVADRREKAMTAGNPRLDNAGVTIGGFVIPARPEEDGTRVAYLVPERGMCSHTPPPPPNQLIRLRLDDEWSPTTMHEPVIVSGKLSIEPSKRQMLVVDGFQTMSATFTLDVAEVQTLIARQSAEKQAGAGDGDATGRIPQQGSYDEKSNQPRRVPDARDPYRRLRLLSQ